jgi:sulfur-carrier protein
LIRVSFTSSFRPALAGADQLELEVSTIRELLKTLVSQYPAMQKHLDEGVAIAIGGEIYRDNWGVEIPADSEVFLMPRIQGG